MPKTSKSNTAPVIQKAPAAAAAPVRATTTTAPDAKPGAPTSNGAKNDQTKPIQSVAGRFPASEGHEVTFKYVAHDAKDVNVAGSFNGWHPEAAPLKKSSAGEWSVQLKLNAGKYEYRFVVDGKWCEDPHATQRGVNPYGGFNSILNVPPGARS
jgi:1,4-alpha-glucan branching enzyme